MDILALALDLVRPLAEDGVERLLGDLDEIGMRDPGAVEALTGLGVSSSRTFTSATAFTSGSRREGMNAAIPPMACAPRLAGLHEELAVRAHERHGHRHLGAVGQHELAGARAS